MISRHSVSGPVTMSSPLVKRYSSSVPITAGILAGPLYLLIAGIQAAVRPGFHITRHSFSLLSNGDLGWVQIGNFVLTGALLLIAAIGLKRTLRLGPGHIWAPRMLGVYGLGLIGAGVFTADPALGFPPGTPLESTPVNWHGLLHFVVGTIGFVGFVALCFIFARRFRELGQSGWSLFSTVTGIFFLAAFIGIASGSKGPVSLYFALAVALGFGWLSLLFIRLKTDDREQSRRG